MAGLGGFAPEPEVISGIITLDCRKECPIYPVAPDRLCPVAFREIEHGVIWMTRVRILVLDIQPVLDPFRTIGPNTTVNIPAELMDCTAILQAGNRNRAQAAVSMGHQ